MRYLVTGGAGFIGSRVCHTLRMMAEDVVSYDVYSRYIQGYDLSYEWNTKYRQGLLQGVNQMVGDVNDDKVLGSILLDYRPDVIIHLAALPLANRSVRDPREAFDGLLKTAFSLFDLIRLYKLKVKIVFISSSMIYGDFESDPIRETARTDPKEIYGSMKLGSEFMARAYSRVFDIPLTIIRPSAVYGPGDTNRRVVQIFVERAMEGSPITLNGADTTLDFTYIKDIAQGVVKAAMSDNSIGKTYNVTTGHGRTLLELAAILKKHFPLLEINEDGIQETYIPKRGSLCIEAAKEDFGYSPEYTLETGIEEYVKVNRGFEDGFFRDF